MLIKPIFVLWIDVSVQNAVGAEKYGTFFSLYNLSLIFNILLDVGITNFNNRNIAQHPFLLSKYYGKLIGIRFVLFISYFIIVSSIALISDYNKEEYYLLIFLLINQLLLQFILYLRSNISGLMLFTKDTVISVLDRLILIVLVGGLLLSKYDFKIEWYIYSHTISYFITCTLAFAIVCNNIKSKIRIKIKKEYFFLIFKKSFPFALLILFMSIYNRFDGFIIERILDTGKEKTGIFAQAFRLLDAYSMIGFLFAGLLLPIFSKIIKQKADLSEIFKISFILLIFPSIFFSFTIFFYSKNILSLLYQNHLNESAQLIKILIFSSIPISVSYITGTLLTAAGKLKFLNKLAFTACLFNIISNIVLLKIMGINGAAITSVITQTFVVISQLIFIQKKYKIKIKLKLNLLILYFILYLFALKFLIQYLNFNINIWFEISIFILTGSLFLIVIAKNKIKTILNYIKSKN